MYKTFHFYDREHLTTHSCAATSEEDAKRVASLGGLEIDHFCGPEFLEDATERLKKGVFQDLPGRWLGNLFSIDWDGPTTIQVLDIRDGWVYYTTVELEKDGGTIGDAMPLNQFLSLLN